jgi:hypothetical protein
MEPLAFAVAAALALIILLRRPGVFSPVLVALGENRWPGTPVPGDDEDQMPETDRAPRHWLTWGVAAIATVRLACLLTLHA